MGEIDNIIQLNITVATDFPTSTGFGIPLVTAFHTNWPERVRSYTDKADMVTDGFAVTDPAYLAVNRILSQNPRPTEVLVGRTALDAVTSFNITPTAVNSTAYTITIASQAATYTSDATATVAEICTGLKTAIDALSLNVTVTDNITDIDVVANSAADNFSLYVNSMALMAVQNETTDGGIATDLAAIRAEDDTWYGWIPTNQGKAVTVAAAAAVESIRKIMFVSTQDQDVADDGVGNLADTLDAAGYNRTVLMFHSRASHEFPCGGWAGKNLPQTPGSINWSYKNIAGVTYDTLSSTQRTNLTDNSCNYYTRVSGLSSAKMGWVAGGSNSFIDITRGVDWFYVKVQENILGLLHNTAKIPQTNAGIAQVENEIWGAIREGISNDMIDAGQPASDTVETSTQPWVTFPDISAISATNKAARHLPDGKFWWRFTGAFNTVAVAGVVTI